jgi:hypothetical protein
MPANYTHVNAAWPDNTPAPTPQEALSGAKRLYRLAMGRAYRGKWKLTSGRRHTWPRRGTFYVNPNRIGWGFSGWKEITHSISHHAARRLHPHARPHSGQHAFLERTLAEHVVKSGWLDGKLKRPEQPKAEVDQRAIRAVRVQARIDTWERKKRRAETALRKLTRQRAYYERQLSL